MNMSLVELLDSTVYGAGVSNCILYSVPLESVVGCVLLFVCSDRFGNESMIRILVGLFSCTGISKFSYFALASGITVPILLFDMISFNFVFVDCIVTGKQIGRAHV